MRGCPPPACGPDLPSPCASSPAARRLLRRRIKAALHISPRPGSRAGNRLLPRKGEPGTKQCGKGRGRRPGAAASVPTLPRLLSWGAGEELRDPRSEEGTQLGRGGGWAKAPGPCRTGPKLEGFRTHSSYRGTGFGPAFLTPGLE